MLHEEVQSTNYNLTKRKKIFIFKPKNFDELKKFIKKKKNFFIKTGSCSYGDKSYSENSKNLLSLEKFNKIIKLKKKDNIIEAESGINLYELSFFLYRKGYFIYNVPGGLTVTLGGAIAGNVHGRFSEKKFSNFGDNIKSVKILNKYNKIVKINRKNNLFNKIIGSFGAFGVIISAEIYINKIQSYNYERTEKLITNKFEFDKLFKKSKNFYGYINHFNMFKFEGVFFDFNSKKKLTKPLFNRLKIYNWPNFFRVLSYFVNNFSLKIFYKSLFFFKKLNSYNKKILSFEKVLYHSSYLNLLPYFFRNGMLEIQISIDRSSFFYFYNFINKVLIKNNLYPVFFIIKKMHINNKKYYTSFPKNNMSISLGFRKVDYFSKVQIFRKLFNFLKKNRFEVYLTKNEIFNNLVYQNEPYKIINKNKKLTNPKVTNLFFEKIKKYK